MKPPIQMLISDGLTCNTTDTPAAVQIFYSLWFLKKHIDYRYIVFSHSSLILILEFQILDSIKLSSHEFSVLN